MMASRFQEKGRNLAPAPTPAHLSGRDTLAGRLGHKEPPLTRGAGACPLLCARTSAAPVPISPSHGSPSGSGVSRTQPSLWPRSRSRPLPPRAKWTPHSVCILGDLEAVTPGTHSHPGRLSALVLGICPSARHLSPHRNTGPTGRAWTPPILHHMPSTQQGSPQEALNKYVRRTRGG